MEEKFVKSLCLMKKNDEQNLKNFCKIVLADKKKRKMNQTEKIS